MAEQVAERLMRSLRIALLTPFSTAAPLLWLPILAIAVICGALLDIAGRRGLATILFVFVLLWIASWWTCLALYMGKLQRQRGYPLWRRRLALLGWAMIGLCIELGFVVQDAPFKPMQDAGILQGLGGLCVGAILMFLGFLLLLIGAGDLKVE